MRLTLTTEATLHEGVHISYQLETDSACSGKGAIILNVTSREYESTSFIYISPPGIECSGNKDGRRALYIVLFFVRQRHSRRTVRVGRSMRAAYVTSCSDDESVLEETKCGVNLGATVKKGCFTNFSHQHRERPHCQEERASPNLLGWAGVTDKRAA